MNKSIIILLILAISASTQAAKVFRGNIVQQKLETESNFLEAQEEEMVLLQVEVPASVLA